jgi:hypothetical protein
MNALALSALGVSARPAISLPKEREPNEPNELGQQQINADSPELRLAAT